MGRYLAFASVVVALLGGCDKSANLATGITYHPAYAQVLSEQVWIQAEANVTQKSMSVEQAIDEVAARMKVIFEKFQIG